MPFPCIYRREVMPQPWPHAPPHFFTRLGVYMITAGTFGREHLFRSPAHLDAITDVLFSLAAESGVGLQAWAVLANHYHVVASFEHAANSLPHRRWVTKLHAAIAREINLYDGIPGRRVMYQFWDSQLTFEKSWLARLAYVHNNPVHHGLVAVARDYAWCSARWLESNASPAFLRSLQSFKLDRIKVPDDF